MPNYLPEALPSPTSDEISAGFWNCCNELRLCFQTCVNCGIHTHPPTVVCPKCQSLNRTWVEAPSRGRVFSFVWAHTAAHASLKGFTLPYNIAVVEFPGFEGVRLVSNVVDANPEELAIGDAVTLTWEEAQGQWLPRFRKDPL